jgi:hypothetical protein
MSGVVGDITVGACFLVGGPSPSEGDDGSEAANESETT